MIITDRLTTNFTVSELVRPHAVPDDPVVCANLVRLAVTVGQPLRDDWAAHIRRDNLGGNPVINVRDGYRSPRHNAKVGGAKASRHMTGEAFDIFPDVNCTALRNGRGSERDAQRMQAFVTFAERWARSNPAVGGLGIYSESRTGQLYWVHLDIRPRGENGRLAVWVGHHLGSEQ